MKTHLNNLLQSLISLLIMFDVQIKWLTKKVKTLFKVKDKSLHLACKVLTNALHSYAVAHLQ